MWNVEYKTNKNSQAWAVLESYDNMTSACINASRVASEYFMIKVTGQDGNVIWSKS